MSEKICLAIYGAGGLGREVLELAKRVNEQKSKFERFFFVDDISPNRQVHHIDVLTFDEIKEQYSPKNLHFVIAVGEPDVRKKLYHKVQEAGYQLEVLVHPSVHIPETTKIGDGTCIGMYAFISCDVKIGCNAYIQPLTGIGHDIQIGNHSIISAHTSLGGSDIIGDCTYIGMSVTVREKLTIGSETIVGMGSTVYKDIPDQVIAMGSPARVYLKNDDKKVFK